MVILKPDKPRKGDIAIIRHTYTKLHGGIMEYYTAEYLTRGGKKPLNAKGSPIYPRDIVGLIRPGWPLKEEVSARFRMDLINKLREMKENVD